MMSFLDEKEAHYSKKKRTRRKTFQAEANAAPEKATPTEVMTHRPKTKERRKRYVLCKQIVEPVFGIIKSLMGFRQFSLRGVAKVRGV